MGDVISGVVNGVEQAVGGVAQGVGSLLSNPAVDTIAGSLVGMPELGSLAGIFGGLTQAGGGSQGGGGGLLGGLGGLLGGLPGISSGFPGSLGGIINNPLGGLGGILGQGGLGGIFGGGGRCSRWWSDRWGWSCGRRRQPVRRLLRWWRSNFGFGPDAGFDESINATAAANATDDDAVPGIEQGNQPNGRSCLNRNAERPLNIGDQPDIS